MSDELTYLSTSRIIERALATAAVVYGTYRLVSGARDRLDSALASLPGVDAALESEVDSVIKDVLSGAVPARADGLPTVGRSADEMDRELEEVARGDKIKPEQGKSFAYVYTPPTTTDVDRVTEAAVSRFGKLNALNPTAFPSLRAMEIEVVQMIGSMLHAPEGAQGTMSSGGTESIILAVKVAREYARERGIDRPSVVLPRTAHPAFAKAGHLLNVEMIYVQERAETRTADVGAMLAAIRRDTIMIVGSAPQYPHGVLDPIAELAAAAAERNLLCHVDSCIGGFVLPFLDPPCEPFDFRLPGVTSISIDAHKYGYTAKGASVVMYRSGALRRLQYFSQSTWPGGLFVSPSILGSRAGGPIAGCWAVMRHLGLNGYREAVAGLMDTAQQIREAVKDVEHVHIIGDPVMSILSIGSDTLNIFSVADRMEARGNGWKLERNLDSIHMTLMPSHSGTAGLFVEDLKAAVAEVAADPARYANEGSAGMYGSLAKIPSSAIVDKFLIAFMDRVYQHD
eukprot:TRINITY_DN2868_c0_g1_i1.p1 TRINITY_DN2868_c0_g1~~TRINITY_DN2868_c0_g1_i1.p1  ORF type:complete len:549 (-),score=248.77 TRINITY_DN2868_c0_g1_i1:49-1584(-)